LEFLPQLHLTCVDLFQYTDEFFPDRKEMRSDFTGGARFDKNLRKFSGRYDKIIAPSWCALADMILEKKKFDLIYIDGSHYRDDVLLDAFMSWKLLNENGVIIFDDYVWRLDLPAADRPKDAIDLFIYCHLNDLTILHNKEQLIIRKIQ
jgi:Methyltransferase domain